MIFSMSDIDFSWGNTLHLRTWANEWHGEELCAHSRADGVRSAALHRNLPAFSLMQKIWLFTRLFFSHWEAEYVMNMTLLTGNLFTASMCSEITVISVRWLVAHMHDAGRLVLNRLHVKISRCVTDLYYNGDCHGIRSWWLDGSSPCME